MYYVKNQLRKLLLLASLGIVIFTTAAYANQFESCRCKNGLAAVGDDKQEVLNDCGKPFKTEFTAVSIRGKRVHAEKWVYNFGPQEFIQAISFDSSGKVLVVESLGRGF